MFFRLIWAVFRPLDSHLVLWVSLFATNVHAPNPQRVATCWWDDASFRNVVYCTGWLSRTLQPYRTWSEHTRNKLMFKTKKSYQQPRAIFVDKNLPHMSRMSKKEPKQIQTKKND